MTFQHIGPAVSNPGGFPAMNPYAARGMMPVQMPQQQYLIQTSSLLPGVARHADLTVSNAATPFGCCNFFDDCNEGIFSLHFRGTLGLLDLLNFSVSEDCYREIDFIEYVRPAQSAGSSTTGWVSNACNPPNGVEFGATSLSVNDFGLVGRGSFPRKILKPKRYCHTSQRQRLDGSIVENEFEWDLTYTMDGMLDDVRRYTITGNASMAGQFDGLRRWVSQNYASQALHSYVVDWNGNPMTGGAGITVNGVAVGTGFDIVDLLLDINNQINQRISWSPQLRSQSLMLGQKFLMMPWFMIRCLLDFYTCWSVCAAGQTVDSVDLNSLEARAFRKDLNGGVFGFGFIELDGEVIPLLGYDWELMSTASTGEIFFLTTGVGNFNVWEGDFLDAEEAIREAFGDLDQAGQGSEGFFTLDAGRVLGRRITDELCRKVNLWMALRLFCKAPWMQARIQNVQCTRSIRPISPDPESDYFFISSFDSAECP